MPERRTVLALCGSVAVAEGISQEETVPSLDGPRQGTNEFDELGYRGPLPPENDSPHTCRITGEFER